MLQETLEGVVVEVATEVDETVMQLEMAEVAMEVYNVISFNIM
jgi:hypothetical protein